MAETARPRCSIVIRAYNEEQHIGRLLTGISQQTVKNLEIILVDSGSTDATVSIAEKFPVKVVHINSEDFTFGYSLNTGIEAASGEFIVIASAHVYPVYEDWLEKLLEPFEDGKVALSYGKQRGAATTKYSEHQFFRQWFPEIPNFKQSYPFCNNANAAIRRELWESRPYDETLTGLEDLAWARKIMDEGFRVAYAADAVIIHVHDETPPQVFNRFKREAMAFKYIFPQEEFRFRTLIRLFLTNLLSDWGQAIKERTFFRVAWSVVWFRWLQFYGTYRGYRQSGPVTGQLRRVFYYPAEEKDQSIERNQARPIQYGEEKER